MAQVPAVEPTTTRVGAHRDPKPVKLWSWPKIIFLYPTMLAAFVAGFGSLLWAGGATTWGLVFVVVFFVNAVVMAFDFPRTTSLNLLLLVVALVLGAILVNQHLVTFLPALRRWIGYVTPQANAQFYLLVAGILALIYLVVLVVDFRFDYWLVEPNEIVHRRGLLGSVARYPAPGLELQKEVTDVFEYVPFGFGRLIIQPQRGPAIVLENVHQVDKKVRAIRNLLDALNVEISEREPTERT